MEKEFVTYTQALALKELGFDESCWSYFITPFDEGEGIFNPSMFLKDYVYLDTMPKHSSYILAPLKQQVFRWFRDEYKIETVVACFYSKRLEISYEERQYHCHIVRDGITTKGPKFKTYEEAESACIDKLIEIVKK